MRHKPHITVLCYHGVSHTWPTTTAVRPSDLQRQLRMLVDAGYQGVTLVNALTAPPADRLVVVTFDDANRSIAELGRPILEEFGVPATVFVPCDYVDSGHPIAWPGVEEWLGTEHEGELQCLGWDELRELAAAGWEVGSHTCSHPRLTRLDDASLRHELLHSRRVIERQLRRTCVSLAYPYSDQNDRVVGATRSAGYGLAVTVGDHPLAPTPLRWPRVFVGRDDSAQRIRMRIERRRRPILDAALTRTLAAARRALDVAGRATVRAAPQPEGAGDPDPLQLDIADPLQLDAACARTTDDADADGPAQGPGRLLSGT